MAAPAAGYQIDVADSESSFTREPWRRSMAGTTHPCIVGKDLLTTPGQARAISGPTRTCDRKGTA